MTQPLFRFSVFSDLHFMTWKETEAPVTWVPTLEHALADMASFRPDLLVINGDLTNGKERDYRFAMRILQQRCGEIPTAFTMGNHEYYGYWEEPEFTLEGARERFLRYTGHDAIYYERRLAGQSFLFLSTERYAPDMDDAGWLSPEQLAWFEQRLAAAPEGPVFAFFHQPVNGTVANSKATCFQSEELRMILRRRPGVLFFTGHTHCRMDQNDQIVSQDGTLFVGGGCPHGRHPQSRWVELHPDKVLIRLRDHTNRQWLETFDYIHPL